MDHGLQASDDPLGLATFPIQLVSTTGGERKDYDEAIGDNSKYHESAVQEIRPREEGSCSYELHDTAEMTIPLGVLVNTNYAINSVSINQSAEGRPTVDLGWIKFSDPAKFKAQASPINVVVDGGYGVVNLYGATLGAGVEPINASVGIEMQTDDAGLGTDQDYIDDGYFLYGFKQTVELQAYGAITLPSGAKLTSEDTDQKSRDGFTNSQKSWWTYLDAHAAI